MIFSVHFKAALSVSIYLYLFSIHPFSIWIWYPKDFGSILRWIISKELDWTYPLEKRSQIDQISLRWREESQSTRTLFERKQVRAAVARKALKTWHPRCACSRSMGWNGGQKEAPETGTPCESEIEPSLPAFALLNTNNHTNEAGQVYGKVYEGRDYGAQCTSNHKFVEKKNTCFYRAFSNIVAGNCVFHKVKHENVLCFKIKLP